MPFGVRRLLYSGRTTKAEAAEVKGEFGEEECSRIVNNHFSDSASDTRFPPDSLPTVPLDTLLAESDFVVISCSLTPETQGMCDKNFFAKMKKTSVFVNSSRYRLTFGIK